MRKLISILFFIAFTLSANSQTVTLTIVTPPCDSNGVLVATFSGMTYPFTASWSSSSGTVNNNHTSSSDVTDTLHGFMGGNVQLVGVDSGSYIMTNDIDTVIPLPFVLTDSAFSATCPALGRLQAYVTGGTGPFSYQWVNCATSSVISTSNPANVTAGYYYSKVTEASGCYLTDRDSIYIYIEPATGFCVSATPAICPGLGSISAPILPPVWTYQWYNVSTGIMVGTSNVLYLPSGEYSVTVTDTANGCTFSNYGEITGTPDFTASITTTPANCSNGTATALISGGTPPFSYRWSTGATTSTVTGLMEGWYRVLITDAIGCTNDTTTADSVVQAVTINVHGVTTSATCLDSNGSITAFCSGGVPPYSYLWSNGATTQSVGGLAASYMNVTVTDANGCLGAMTDYISSSTPITVTYATTPSSCTAPTGSATLTISGGTPPYTINWYTTPPQTGATATSLSPGNYYFHITDALGCTQSGTVTVPPIDVIYLSFTASPDTCLLADGSVSVSASHGVPPYSYSWSNGATTPTVNGLLAGTYYATVTDANGCSVTNCQYVPYNSPLTLGLTTTPASCIYNHDGVIVATASLGTPPYAYSMGGTSTGSVDITGLGRGHYWIYVTDSAGCSTASYTELHYNEYDSSCFCLLKGVVFHDTNDNCIRDIGEQGINHIQMQCSSLGYTYTDSGGNYYFLVPSGSYTISQRVLGFYPLSTCQANNIPYTSVAATGCTSTINFADTVDPIHDMHICTWDYSQPVPGFNYYQVSLISNEGTLTEPGILASYKPDGQLFAPTFVPSGIFTGAPYYYNTADSFPALAPGASKQFLMNYTVPTDIPLGTNVDFKDSISYNAPMSDWLLDYSPWNNINDFTATVVASHDPNFKEVNPKGVGSYGYIEYATDSILEYMIHFQNTGNFEAQNVVVLDTLSPNLDWTTLTPTFLSNKGTVNMDNNGVVTFSFPNIELPPAISEPVTSNALFTYTIKLKTGLADGSQIKNSASIYFDFNPPVVTNTTLNTIGEQTLVNNVTMATGHTLDLYPNPTSNSFTAAINSEINGNADIVVTDLEGRAMIHKTVALNIGQQNVQMNAAVLPAGVYFVTVYGNGSPQTQKLMIMK